MKMCFLNTVVFFLLVLCSLKSCFCEPCPFGSIGLLNLTLLEARCTSTRSTPGFPCHNAIDFNTNSVWIPELEPQTRFPAFFQIRFMRDATISAIDILQHKWPHGRASKIKLEFSEGVSFKVNFPLNEKTIWDRAVLPYPVTTNQIQLVVNGIDGTIFGGFSEINLIGCYGSNQNQEDRIPMSSGYEVYEPSSKSSENLTDQGYSVSTIVGAIIGGIAGLFAAVFFIGVLVYVFVIAKRKKEKENGGEHDGTNLSKLGSSISVSSSSSDLSGHDPEEIKVIDDAS